MCPKSNLQVLAGNPTASAFWRRLGNLEDEVATLGKRLPPRVVLTGARLVPFVTRHQSSSHLLRRSFTDAFRRGTPGHSCHAALEGIALAQGSRELRGVVARRQPVCATHGSYAVRFERMYDEQWRSLSGTHGRLAWTIPLPLQATPLSELNNKNRRRALKLRRHLAAGRASANEAYRSRLSLPPPRVVMPDPGESLTASAADGQAVSMALEWVAEADEIAGNARALDLSARPAPIPLSRRHDPG